MAKRLKRAFTITELVIVIAVVAILAAVLIPTFSNIIKKADESADTQLVKNLNTILSSEQTVSQEAAPTMSKALEQAQEGGYTVDKLTPTSDGDILWEQDSNRFVLVSGGEIIFKDSTTTADIATEPYKFWKITNKESEVTDGEYSHYLADGFTGTAFTVKAGIDTGENTTVTSITYSSPVKSAPAAGAERTVIINTNKNRCNVTVDAPFDTVKRYGDAATVSVNETASQSYHEFGDVNTLVVGEGHVYVDEGGYVGILDCTKAGNATVGKASTGTINSVLVKDDSSAGSILEDSVKTAIENGETEQVKASDVPAESSLFAGGIGTEKSPFLIETAEQFKNISTLYEAKTDEGVEYSGKVYAFEQIADIELPEMDYLIPVFTGIYDGGGYQLSFDESVTSTSFFYFFEMIFDNTVIRNVNIMLRANQPASLIYSTDWYTDTTDLLIENTTVNSNGEIVLANTTNFGFFGCYSITNFISVRFVNCVNNANLINQGTSTGAFVGSGWIFGQDEKLTGAKVEYVNCVNNGNITGGQYVGMLYGNPSYTGIYDSIYGNTKVEQDYSSDLIIIDNVQNTGKIISLITPSGISAFAPNSTYLNTAYQETCGGTYMVGGYFSGKDVYVSQNGGEYSTNMDGADSNITFKIAFNINLLDNGDGTVSNTTKYFYDVATGASVAATNVLTHKAYDSQKAKEVFGEEVVNGLSYDENGIAKYVKDNVMYFIFRYKQIGRNPVKNPAGETSIVVYLYAYDASGGCVGVARIK